jgi:energy-coupling factor transporter transmembrane protein EcfT
MNSIKKQQEKVLKDFGDYTSKKKGYLDEYRKTELSELEKKKISNIVEMKLVQSNSGEVFFGKILTIIAIFLAIASILPDDEFLRSLKPALILLALLVLIISMINRKEDRQDLIKLLEVELKIECIDIVLKEKDQEPKEINDEKEYNEDQILNELHGGIEFLEKNVDKCDSDEKNIYLKEKKIRENKRLIKAKENGLADANNTMSIFISAGLGVVLSMIFTSNISNIRDVGSYLSVNVDKLMFDLVVSTVIILFIVWFKILVIDNIFNSVDRKSVKELIEENEKLHKEIVETKE